MAPGDLASAAPMTPAGRSYATGAAAVTLSTALSAGGGFVSLILLARLLTKDELGGYAFAFNVVTLLALVASWGFERTLMLRIARLEATPSDLRGRALFLRAAFVSGVLSAGLAGVLVIATPYILALGAVPAAGFWLPALAVTLIPMAVSAVMQAWFRANSRIVAASLTLGAVNASRAVFLAIAFAVSGDASSVALAVFVSTCVPILALGLLARTARARPPAFLRREDLGAGAVTVVQKVSNYGLRILDVVLVGLLTSGAETAYYAVAARLALFCGIGTEALQPTFAPRGRRHFATGDYASAAREYHLARAAAFLLSLAMALLLGVLGPLLLAVFGDFQSAYAPLLVGAAGYVVAAGAGLHFPYMHMQGELVGTTVIRIAALLLLIGVSVLIVPASGALGGALAQVAAVLFLNMASLSYMYFRTGFVGVTRASVLTTGLAATVLIAAGLWPVAPASLGAALAAVAGVTLLIDPHSQAVLRFALQRIRPMP